MSVVLTRGVESGHERNILCPGERPQETIPNISFVIDNNFLKFFPFLGFSYKN
jgi:hypothetical protein